MGVTGHFQGFDHYHVLGHLLPLGPFTASLVRLRPLGSFTSIWSVYRQFGPFTTTWFVYQHLVDLPPVWFVFMISGCFWLILVGWEVSVCFHLFGLGWAVFGVLWCVLVCVGVFPGTWVLSRKRLSPSGAFSLHLLLLLLLLVSVEKGRMLGFHRLFIMIMTVELLAWGNWGISGFRGVYHVCIE